MSLTALAAAGCAGGGDDPNAFATFNGSSIDGGGNDEADESDMGEESSDSGAEDNGDTTTTTTDGGGTTTTTDGGGTTTTTDGGGTTTTTDGGETTTTTGGGGMITDMIDDFEDGDGALIPNDGRQGYWYTFNDASVGGVQTPPENMVVPAQPGANGSNYALQTTGSGFTAWGAGIGIDLNNIGGMMASKDPYNASGYSGIMVMARGNGQVRVSMPTVATLPVAEGGSCAADCDPHGMVINLSPGWQQFALPFASMSQEGWGTPASWDASTVVSVQFKVNQNVDFDFSVDDLGFY
ncbi:hypothetical protein PPSIR1_38806 [Plesiocystis pacifica SIR-1]|uniref:Uncharacterized protein n=1 Tax=Plesiocystis pacifica SIR-1 TaxID=391625 RepID=A6G8T4_9BACT|nr:hypothetical protein PPSIR1_38806 [Plesiocystis pacifica SIR-1]